MSLTVCLLLDQPADRAIRRLWARLEAAGVPTLASHTHGRHVPHLTYASLVAGERAAVLAALGSLPAREELTLHLDGFGTFRRSRCWLAPAVTADLAQRQSVVAHAVKRPERRCTGTTCQGSGSPT